MLDNNFAIAKTKLDALIKKARVHLYKPIQIAEILYRDRVYQDINIEQLESYRNPSKQWRDIVCRKFLGRTSSSSARYQDDLFNETAIPPNVLSALAYRNRQTDGAVEAYIYLCVGHKFSQLSKAILYCETHDRNHFNLLDFLDLFWKDAGLKRSIDKVYEIVVYALFSALVDSLDISLTVSMNPEKHHILLEFSDFAKRVIGLSANHTTSTTLAKLYRVGVTNAADRGLDMWANFGLAIQIKHLSLNEELAEGIVQSITADRIVIVCKAAEQKIILSLLNQLGWKSRIQDIITEHDLMVWYEKALRGQYHAQTASNVLKILKQEIQREFPITAHQVFQGFFEEREYHKVNIESLK